MEIPPYSVQPYLRDRFDAVGKALRFTGDNAESVAAWKVQARAKLSELLGLPTMRPCDPRPEVVESVDCGEYVREKVLIDTEPGIRMPFYVLLPKGWNAACPAVLAVHGHGGGGGKLSIAGIGDDPLIAKAIADFNYDYGVQYCKAGCVVFCPDARGFGERREQVAMGDITRHSCQWINNMAMPLGQTVTGMWVWDLMRLIDYAQTRPECDAKRLGCAGLSGGGLQTLWLTALEERVKAAVVSGYFYGVKESLLDMNQNCSCNYVPHLWENADHGDLGSLIAPRPLLIQTGDVDSLNGESGVKNVEPQVAIAKRVYAVLGAEQNIHHDVFHGPHRWDSTHAVPFLVSALTH